MTDAELDHCYTVLCQALGKVGPQRSELLLAMVALALMARYGDAEGLVALVERSRDRCLES
jgi:hypothetical protein